MRKQEETRNRAVVYLRGIAPDLFSFSIIGELLGERSKVTIFKIWKRDKKKYLKELKERVLAPVDKYGLDSVSKRNYTDHRNLKNKGGQN